MIYQIILTFAFLILSVLGGYFYREFNQREQDLLNQIKDLESKVKESQEYFGSIAHLLPKPKTTIPVEEIPVMQPNQ